MSDDSKRDDAKRDDAARLEDSSSFSRRRDENPKTVGGGPRPGRPLVQIEKLSKVYPIRRGLFAGASFVHAVDGVSFYIRRGETLGLVGESGCGKSTLGRAILRLIEPTLGRIVFDGRDITRLPEPELRPMRRRMQIVFQDPYSSLNPRMTLREIIGEGITVFRLAASRDDADSMVALVLKRVGLRPDMMGRYPHELSGGQRQRVGIARALAVKPDFIVCDEPVSALDVSIQAQILNLLEELQDELSMSLLFISHDLRATTYASHRIAVMYLGRIVEIGPTSDVQEKRYHPYTRALFGAIPGSPPDFVAKSDGLPPDSVAPRSIGGTPFSPARTTRRTLTGEPPSPIDPPRGCVFHTRCPRAEKGRCDVEAPPLEEIVPNSHHRVACWHPELE